MVEVIDEIVDVHLVNGKSFVNATALASDVSTLSINPKDSKQQFVIPWTSILYMKYMEKKDD